MTAQLYTVYTNTDQRQLIMTAPMSTLSQVFRFHKEAEQRIIRETTLREPGLSIVHFNGRGSLPWDSIQIELA